MYITGTALPSLAFHKEILGFYQKKKKNYIHESMVFTTNQQVVSFKQKMLGHILFFFFVRYKSSNMVLIGL